MAALRPISLGERVFWIGVNDRETDLFEGLWPLPEGISYNAYAVLDRKTALIDTVREPYFEEYLEKVDALLPEGGAPDFLVVNHIEPDHSGSLAALRRRYPDLTIVGNKWTLRLLEQYHGITTGTRLVKDGDILDLGSGSIRFLLTPMVHWPETMLSLDESSKTIFTGDLFGGYGALEGALFDDETDAEAREDETRRYFTNVLARFSPMVSKALGRLGEADYDTIAPSHGIVWRRRPENVVRWFSRWSHFEGDTGATVAYASMYGNTKSMSEAVVRGLAESGVHRISVHDLSRSHLSYVLSDVWRSGTLVLGSPTYNTRPFPAMAALVDFLSDKGLKNRRVGLFGSYGWSGGAIRDLRKFVLSAGLTLVDPVVEVKGAPSSGDLSQCHDLGVALAREVALRPAVQGDNIGSADRAEG